MDLTRFKGLPDWAKAQDPRAHCYSSYTDRSIERLQLDEAVEANAETADYLYSDFTSPTVTYPRGTRPLLETIVERVCQDLETGRDRAIALVRWRRANYTHVPRCGLGTEEEIILGGYSMCHDASRTLIALCQVAGLGARMVIGLNAERKSGHTLAEVFVDGRWALFDPTPTLPWAFCRHRDGTFLSAWDLRQDSELLAQCETEFPVADPASIDRYASFFSDYRLANYSLEESTRNMATRFLRLIAAQKIVENYDYQGHLSQKRLSAFTDLDAVVDDWLSATLSPDPSI